MNKYIELTKKCKFKTIYGFMNIELTDQQKQLLNLIDNADIMFKVMDRQTYKTTTACLYILNRIIEGKTKVLVSTNKNMFVYILDIISDAYFSMLKPDDEHLRFKRTKNKLKFSNGSTIELINFNSIPEDIDILYVDEYKFLKLFSIDKVFNIKKVFGLSSKME